MARPKSEDKRQAILAAAIAVFANQGLGAATAKIARRAGVSEGTLFNYFSNKDALLNALYLELKNELSSVMLPGFPDGQDLRGKAFHIWRRYIEWGVENPDKRQSMALLGLSDRVDASTREKAMAGFVEVNRVIHHSVADGSFCGRSPDFAGAIMGALAETTMDFIGRERDKAEFYTTMGFDAFWRAIAG
ncbi:TetR/AcrR family transcriptional regulator [Acerihabitans sp. KWT182]|uniref:TetR/AcrR family transcriptional regulator n=1 Tax=Acerihabitans sp. KWT182 TaxID=3157919 RepID=A0AAU7Q5X2_9GAMM